MVAQSQRELQMNPQELSRTCRLIIDVVGRWLSDQSEMAKAMHWVAIETIEMAGDVLWARF